MALRAGRALSVEALGLAALRGDGWFAWVDPAWRDALETAGWLGPDPLEGRAQRTQTPQRGGRGALFRAELEPGSLVIRPFRRGGWLAPILVDAYASSSRPLNEALVSAILRARGAPVPEPVMAIAWREGSLFWRGLIATREIENVDNGFAFLARGLQGAPLHTGLAAAGRALRQFHDAGGAHPDLNLGNLLVSRNQNAAWVIDLDGASCRETARPRTRMRELMRLFRSLRKSGTPDRNRLALRLFHHYCQGDRALRSALLRWHRYERCRVALHALRYPG